MPHLEVTAGPTAGDEKGWLEETRSVLLLPATMRSQTQQTRGTLDKACKVIHIQRLHVVIAVKSFAYGKRGHCWEFVGLLDCDSWFHFEGVIALGNRLERIINR